MESLLWWLTKRVHVCNRFSYNQGFFHNMALFLANETFDIFCHMQLCFPILVEHDRNQFHRTRFITISKNLNLIGDCNLLSPEDLEGSKWSHYQSQGMQKMGVGYERLSMKLYSVKFSNEYHFYFICLKRTKFSKLQEIFMIIICR